jgi:hypothetical protein
MERIGGGEDGMLAWARAWDVDVSSYNTYL